MRTIALFALFGTLACDRIEGRQAPEYFVRCVDEFSALTVSNGLFVHVCPVQDEESDLWRDDPVCARARHELATNWDICETDQQQILMRGSYDILSYVRPKLAEGQLELSTSQELWSGPDSSSTLAGDLGLDHRSPITVVVVADVNTIEARHTSRVHVRSVASQHLSVGATDMAWVKVGGRVETAELGIGGEAEIDASGLIATQVQLSPLASPGIPAVRTLPRIDVCTERVATYAWESAATCESSDLAKLLVSGIDVRACCATALATGAQRGFACALEAASCVDLPLCPGVETSDFDGCSDWLGQDGAHPNGD